MAGADYTAKLGQVIEDRFPKWRNFCLGIDAEEGRLNLAFDGSHKLRNVTIPTWVNSSGLLVATSEELIETMEWTNPSLLIDYNVFDGETVSFESAITRNAIL